jgi:3-hydroxybutyryl-CoA dehydrogenase
MAGRVAVIGAGLMGSGIAQVAAQAGWQVALSDVDESAVNRGLDGIRTSLSRFAAKGQLDGDVEEILGRITAGVGVEPAAEADIVVEAVFESLDVKRRVFADLDRVCRPDAVLATNTSAIPVTQIAAVTKRPESVVGTHFFSPVPMMRLCELVRGYKTSDETLARARAFAEDTGKTCIVVNRDIAGFVTTRLIAALVVEAVRLVESGVVTPEDLDVACQLGFGHKMGPLATTDLTGVDVLLHATRNIYSDTGDQKFFPPELLQRMVTAGDLGRKSGRGFYPYGSAPTA